MQHDATDPARTLERFLTLSRHYLALSSLPNGQPTTAAATPDLQTATPANLHSVPQPAARTHAVAATAPHVPPAQTSTGQAALPAASPDRGGMHYQHILRSLLLAGSMGGLLGAPAYAAEAPHTPAKPRQERRLPEASGESRTREVNATAELHGAAPKSLP